MIDKPLISVVMPIYNSENFVAEAIESILNQSYINFEFLIFDDCSTDKSIEIIGSFKDERIKLFKNLEHKGLVVLLNQGLQIAKGDFIARMDADDVSHPDRLLSQVLAFEENKDLGVCGTVFTTFGDNNIKVDLPENQKQIFGALLTGCCIGHPTVMFRRKILTKWKIFYDNSFYTAEDYELWTRLIFITKFKNLQKPLLKYRVQEKQISQTQAKLQNELAQKISLNYFKKICITLTKKKITATDFGNEVFNFLIENERLLIRINKKQNLIDEIVLQRSLLVYYQHCIVKGIKYNLLLLAKSFNSLYFENLSPLRKLKFIAKNILLYKGNSIKN